MNIRILSINPDSRKEGYWHVNGRTEIPMEYEPLVQLLEDINASDWALVGFFRYDNQWVVDVSRQETEGERDTRLSGARDIHIQQIRTAIKQLEESKSWLAQHGFMQTEQSAEGW